MELPFTRTDAKTYYVSSEGQFRGTIDRLCEAGWTVVKAEQDRVVLALGGHTACVDWDAQDAWSDLGYRS